MLFNKILSAHTGMLHKYLEMYRIDSEEPPAKQLRNNEKKT